MSEETLLKSDFQVVPLSRDTLQERVYRQVSDLILDGQIAPGQLVTIQSLADSFKVSATPVREALKRLAAAGALTLVTGRAMGIPRLSLDKLTDLKRVREEVEGVAVEWAARNRTSADLAELERLDARLEKAVAQNDISAYLRSNRAFHFASYRASQSPTLVAMIETLWLQISPYFNLLRESNNYASSNEQHRALFLAIKMQDSVAAKAALRADIEGAYAILSHMLQG
ncbi:GntR family transcriptional regulator [Rhodoligotrophos ferricapiens]|uniref:GntR family transcriptional regulator n=1 Tax=Rhodoligotrophos ferricapiens TaxID=3069264 RepID=UPI00315C6964